MDELSREEVLRAKIIFQVSIRNLNDMLTATIEVGRYKSAITVNILTALASFVLCSWTGLAIAQSFHI